MPDVAGLVGLLAVALVASSQVASAAPKDKVEVLDGATLDDPSCEPKPVSGAFSMLDRSERGIATKSDHSAPQIATTRTSLVWESAGSGGQPGRTPEAGRSPGRR